MERVQQQLREFRSSPHVVDYIRDEKARFEVQNLLRILASMAKLPYSSRVNESDNRPLV
jgi:hypothetical protein